MSRPKKKERKTIMFRLLLTESQKEYIERMAEEKGLSQSDVVRKYYIK